MQQTQQSQTAIQSIPTWTYPPPLNPNTIMVGTYAATVSATGTIELPEPFLSVLRTASETEIGLYLNRYSNCIEGCGIDFGPFVILYNPISVPVSDGKVAVPSEWASRVGLTNMAILIGMGRTFQICSPTAFEGVISALNERQSAT